NGWPKMCSRVLRTASAYFSARWADLIVAHANDLGGRCAAPWKLRRCRRPVDIGQDACWPARQRMLSEPGLLRAISAGYPWAILLQSGTPPSVASRGLAPAKV